MLIYFTLLNTGTKEEEHLKPFILQYMKIKSLNDPFQFVAIGNIHIRRAYS